MSKTDKERAAVERVTKRIYDHGQQQQQVGGKPISERDARKMAVDVAVRNERNRK